MSSIRTATILVILAVIVTGISMANKPNDGDVPLRITVSPSTLVLSRYAADDVTVHSNILYDSLSDDYKDSLRLSGPIGNLIEPAGMFADICGDLVVKFEIADVKDIVVLGQVELVLVLEIEGDDPEIIASDTIRVKD